VGGARTALFNWLFARKHGGVFILRVEDTDQARSTDESVDAIFEGMRWLDLAWDEGPGAAEPHAPYFQTERLDIYNAYADKLMAAGRAYRSYLTKEELAAKRAEQEARGEHPHYERSWSDLDDATRARYEAEGRPFVVRFKAPDAGTIVVKDVLRGDVSFDAAQMVDDFVLIKNDGIPTYNYAVVIDDATMDVTHVIRGDDHLSNTPKQIAVFEALGLPVPVFCHLPMILGADKSKLSKRHGTTSVQLFRDQGFLPEALINYLVRLGWSHGDQEYFTREEMIEKFSLEALNKSAAVFDFAKLEAMNMQYIKEADRDRLVALVTPRWEAMGLPVAGRDRAWLHGVIKTLQERSRTLVQLAEGAKPFFDVPLAYDPAAVEKQLGPDSLAHLAALRAPLAALEPWDEASLEALFKGYAEEKGAKLGQVIQPMRVAMTGKTASPGMYEVLALLGRELTLRRLDAAVGGVGVKA
jgi:glutamyl-tRNA synthetase